MKLLYLGQIRKQKVFESVKPIFNVLVSTNHENNNQISSLEIKDKETDAYFNYFVYDWPHAGRTGMYKGPDVADGL